MDISEPVLFLGLGGTGVAVGQELEDWLREAVCGPSGRDFIDKLGLANAASDQPFQLPSTLQFVYADLDQDDMRDIIECTDVRKKNRWPVKGINTPLETYSQADRLSARTARAN